MNRHGLHSTLSLLGMAALLGVATARVIASRDDQASQPLAPAPERLAIMRHHFIEVTLIHEAVIRGDLRAVAQPATRLSVMTVPPGAPLTAEPYVAAIREAGWRAAVATTLAGVAEATVDMLTQCASCHSSVGVRPAPTTRKVPDVGGIVGHMLDHQRAADEMLQGLLIPSASEWLQGAEHLRGSVLHASDLPRDSKWTPAVLSAEESVHVLADLAAAADTLPRRSTAYVRLLTKCAECHSLHRSVWGPTSPR